MSFHWPIWDPRWFDFSKVTEPKWSTHLQERPVIFKFDKAVQSNPTQVQNSCKKYSFLQFLISFSLSPKCHIHIISDEWEMANSPVFIICKYSRHQTTQEACVRTCAFTLKHYFQALCTPTQVVSYRCVVRWRLVRALQGSTSCHQTFCTKGTVEEINWVGFPA